MRIAKNKRDTSPPTMFLLGADNETVLDKLCAFLFALTPVVQHYYGLYENAGFTLYLFILPIMILKLIQSGGRLKRGPLLAVMPLVLFELYCVIARIETISRVLYSLFMIVFLILLFNGCLNIQQLFKYAVWIGMIATALILVQYISYYLFHRVINFEPHRWLLPENSRWDVKIVYSKGKLYRPSGFFLEPSHIFLYCLPLIAFCLLLPDIDRWRKRTALILSIGVVLSTSGMGIFIVFGLWALYYLTQKNASLPLLQQIKKAINIKSIAFIALLAAGAVLAFYTIPFFRQAVVRIFTNENASSAIAGRTKRAGNYIRTISGKEMIFGTPNIKKTLSFSASGFFATYIKWGLIGLVLSYAYYIQGLFKLKNAYFWFSFLMIVLSFFTAHTHGTFYLMYFSAFLANGYYTEYVKNRNPVPEARPQQPHERTTESRMGEPYYHEKG